MWLTVALAGGPIAGYGLGVISGYMWARAKAMRFWREEFRTLALRREMHDAGRSSLPREGATPVTLRRGMVSRDSGAVTRDRPKKV